MRSLNQWICCPRSASVIRYTKDMSRIYLKVPFAEKEQAKGIGARWDGQRKAWWIDSTVDKSVLEVAASE